MPRNHPWTKEELILALELYFRSPTARGNKHHPDVKALSNLLQSLPIYPKSSRLSKFRNANGVSMKLINFRSCDKNHSGTGLPNSNSLEKSVWDQFSGDLKELKLLAAAIATHAAQLADPPDDLSSGRAEEGGILYRVHRTRERDPSLVKKKKAQVLSKKGRLCCEICEFDFERVYGVHGAGYAECHHTKPIAAMRPNDTTSTDDLCIVCANCHRMLHRTFPPMGVETLKRIYAEEAHLSAIRTTFPTRPALDR